MSRLVIPQIVTVEVLYSMPDYKHVVQVFVWQTDDVPPELPRVNKFIEFWKENLDGALLEWRALVSETPPPMKMEDYRIDAGTIH